MVLFVNTARTFTDLNRVLFCFNSQNPGLALEVRPSSCVAVSIFIVTGWSTSEKPTIYICGRAAMFSLTHVMTSC